MTDDLDGPIESWPPSPDLGFEVEIAAFIAGFFFGVIGALIVVLSTLVVIR